MPSKDSGVLARRFHETKQQLRSLWLKLWGGSFLVLIIGFGLAWMFVKPAPPSRITIAAGPIDGQYYQYALQYADKLAQQGITLDVRETAGSLENYQLLEDDPEVELAIVQGGTAPRTIYREGRLEALASLYLEPLWVFVRRELEIRDLRDLRDRQIAIGADDSGTQSIARTLLLENGMESSEIDQLDRIGGREAVSALQSEEVDAAFFVIGPESSIVSTLMHDPQVKLVGLKRHAAYARRHPFLTSIVLEQGVVDLQADLPVQRTPLIAPAANLVCTDEFHDALIPLLLKAAQDVHETDQFFGTAGRFPSTELREFPLNESARRYFQNGPPFLQKYLPFWVASAIDRGKVLLLPLVTLLFPFFKLGPPLYRWRIRSRIYRWYEILREIESDLRNDATRERLEHHRQALREMEGELDDLRSVPLSYMEEFYNLRLHVELVERRVLGALNQTPAVADS